jgi:hypothetical protein
MNAALPALVGVIAIHPVGVLSLSAVLPHFRRGCSLRRRGPRSRIRRQMPSAAGQGVLTRVASIQRIHAEGGAATECEYVRRAHERQRVKERVLGGLLFMCASALKRQGRVLQAALRNEDHPA